MERKIIFFDVDGTIFSPQIGAITDKVKKSIAATREKGHLCFIASGRPYSFIAENVKEIRFDGYILVNGAQIRYQDKDIKTQYMNYEDSKELCHRLRAKNIGYMLATPSLSYMGLHYIGSQSFYAMQRFYSRCNIDFKDFVYDYNEDEILHQIVKMEVWAKNEEELIYAVNCFQKFAYTIHPCGETLEVYANGVSKGTGILDVLNFLNLPVKNSYCFGNDLNDMEMFGAVGRSIAMGNAVSPLKNIANDICLDVMEDGVAIKLNEIFL